MSKPKPFDMLNDNSGLAEFGLDQFLEDGVFKDIPVVGAILGVVKTVSTARDVIFANKLKRFLFVLHEFDENQKSIILEALESKKERMRAGEFLITIIERISDIEKADILAKLFKAYLTSRIDYDIFVRLSLAVDRAHVPDLIELKNSEFGWLKDQKQYVLDGLTQAGLVSPALSLPMGGGEIVYYVSELGKEYIAVVLD